MKKYSTDPWNRGVFWICLIRNFSLISSSRLYNFITEDCISGSPVAKKLPECGSSKTTYDASKQFCYHENVYGYDKYVECDGALYFV